MVIFDYSSKVYSTENQIDFVILKGEMIESPLDEIWIDQISLQFYANNRVEIHYPKEFEITIETARKMDQIIVDHVQLNDFTLLVNFENSFGSMPREVQRYFAREAPSSGQLKKSAIVLNSLGIQILVKFYMNFFKPAYPTQIFSSVDSAREWLGKMVLIDQK